MLDGLAGAFFRPLALSYVLAILASLAVALTVTPALALLLLPKHLDTRESRLVGGLKARYRAHAARRSSIGRRRRSASLAVLLAADGRHGAVPRRGVPAELPRVRLPDALGREAGHVARGDAPHHRAREPRADGGARACSNFGSHIGRAEVADEVVGPNFTELWISLDPVGGLRGDGREDPVDRRRLSRALSRPADLSARAHQGGADRRERDDRRARLRPGARPAASAGAGGARRRSRTSRASPISRCRRRSSCRRSRCGSIPSARRHSA